MGLVPETGQLLTNGDLAYFTTWCPAGTSALHLLTEWGHKRFGRAGSPTI
jgi:hypothetical protein